MLGYRPFLHSHAELSVDDLQYALKIKLRPTNLLYCWAANEINSCPLLPHISLVMSPMVVACIVSFLQNDYKALYKLYAVNIAHVSG